jgi:anti-anti-sigma factor
MEIIKTISGSEAVFAICGWLESQTAPQLEEAVEELDPSVTELVFDLRDLEYISSAGLRQFVAAHKKMNGRLTLINVSSEIMNILKMAGFDRRLHIE